MQTNYLNKVLKQHRKENFKKFKDSNTVDLPFAFLRLRVWKIYAGTVVTKTSQSYTINVWLCVILGNHPPNHV